MPKNTRSAATLIAVGLLALTLLGCQKKEGPAEKAGKAIDNSLSQAGQQIEKAGENIQRAAKDAQK
ncbi:hypothetical protein KVP09_05415 [Alcaligenaceae bacterium CGII-47]|nr:hypothetical protein [Alcaligenaceae bacterium CGII-47]